MTPEQIHRISNEWEAYHAERDDDSPMVWATQNHVFDLIRRAYRAGMEDAAEIAQQHDALGDTAAAIRAHANKEPA